MDFSWTLESAQKIFPEIVLVSAILMIVLLDILPRIPKWAIAGFAGIATIAALVPAVNMWLGGVQAVSIFNPGEPGPGGSAAHDAYGLFFRMIFLAFALLSVVYSWTQVKRWPEGQGEFFALMLSCIFGMMVMATANDLVMMFLSLEFVSVTSYVMTGLLRKNRKSAEGSLKYILYGAAASGVMLFGMSYLYGLTGTVNIVEIGQVLKGKEVPSMLTLIISVFVMGGFAYKIAAAPFHMWCPDVYEGAPTPVTAFFSIGPKLAGFAMLGRFLYSIFPEGALGGAFEWRIVIASVAILTMAVGNLSALWQSNLKRLLAYSGIAHAGYMLLVFLVVNPTPEAAGGPAANLAPLLFYSVIYIFMNLGAFMVVMILEEKYGIETVEQCRGLGWVDWPICTAMALFLFSLTGLPPLAGFMGKLIVFGGVIEHAVADPAKWDNLAIGTVVAAVLFSVISLYYYARVAAKMFLGKADQTPVPNVRTWVLNTLVAIMVAGTLFFGVRWNELWEACKLAGDGMLGAP